MPIYHAEMRQLLWSTILELEVQMSMGLCMLPNVTNFYTTPPSILDDDAFAETTTIYPRQANSINTNSGLVANPTTTLLSAVHRNLINHLTRRSLPALHRPFATKALQDPRYYYSRKVCLDNALLLFTPQPDRNFLRMLLVSFTLFRHIMHHAAIVLYFEIVGQIEEDQAEEKLFRIRQDARAKILGTIKQPCLFAHGNPQIGAMEQGMDVAVHALKAATTAARDSLEILQQQSDTKAQINMNFNFGDMASWVFSDAVDEFRL
ncbi:hypothetical protein BDV30DRAFT_233040 [Aspergillus minisclerotigenes]|uniref:Transcription factor domain-containing protein n=1 Tax=Aspergillus minisclerotigenes TaxID=656917 RepID=A0A5N6JJS1_9EURO|nr:hypothetical protein BDV30DRAFT_233040 [Aspergillus minisclerotigenes]